MASHPKTLARDPRHFHHGLLALLALISAAPLAAAAGPWAANEQARVRLISPWRVAPDAGELLVGLRFELAPGWHVYWKNSGDAGYPPEVDFAATPGLRGAELLWPAPERYQLPGDLVAFGYEEEVVYPVVLHFAGGLGSRVPIAADLDYLVCRIDCLPYAARLTLDQAVGPEPAEDPPAAALLAAWRERVPVAAERVPGLSTRASLTETPQRGLEMTIAFDGVVSDPAELDLFFAPHDLLAFGRPAAEGAPGRVRFRVPVELRARRDSPPETTELAWTVTGLPPAAAGAASVEARQLVAVPPGGGATREAVAPEQPAPLLHLVGGAALGAALLNLAPPVLALLVWTAMRWRRTPERAWRAAGVRAAGVLAGLAALALLGVASGRLLPGGWGIPLEAPWAAAGLALLVVFLALHLWGHFDLFPPRGGASSPVGEAGGGLLAVLLALPWTAPFLGNALAQAFARSGGVALAVSCAAALGLAGPYLAVAGTLAAGRGGGREGARGGRMPSPVAREALGFLAAAGAVWLLYVLAQRLDAARLAATEIGLLATAAVAWFRQEALERAGASGWRRGAWNAVLLLAVAATLWAAGP